MTRRRLGNKKHTRRTYADQWLAPTHVIEAYLRHRSGTLSPLLLPSAVKGNKKKYGIRHLCVVRCVVWESRFVILQRHTPDEKVLNSVATLFLHINFQSVLSVPYLSSFNCFNERLH
jgi:hypothetical protein